MIQSSGGVFEVDVDGRRVYSKKGTKRHAESGEVVRLIPGTSHGLGYLEPAGYQRTVDVLSSAANPVIRQKPEGAWTHAVWDKAFAR